MDIMQLRKILEDTGFTEGESKVYLALLELGESRVGPLIKSSGISRSKVYDILERLITKSVVSKVEKNGVMVYQSLPPYSILNIIRKKEKELKQEEKILNEILPQLSLLQPKQKVNVLVYEGYEGFKAMINRTIQELTSKDIYDAMGISQTTKAMTLYARRIYEAQKNKKFKARSIFDEKGAFKAAERKTKWHEMRILPKGWNTPALFTIYSDTVGIHLGKDDSIISIVIKNEDIAKSFKATFEAMWKISKKIK